MGTTRPVHAAAAYHDGKPYLTACGKQVRPGNAILIYPVVAVEPDQFRAARLRCKGCQDALDGFEHEPTGTERLFAAGYTHRPSGNGMYAHDIIDASGAVVFTGTVRQATEWLDAQLAARGAA